MPQVQVVKKSKFSPKARAVAVLLCVLIIAGGAAVVWLMRPAPPNDTTLQDLRAGRILIAAPTTQARLEEAAAKVPKKADQIELWEAASSSAKLNSKFEAAAADALKAEELGTDHSTNAISLGGLYRDHLNDNSKALKYYRLGLERTKAAQANGTELKSQKQLDFLEAQIKGLEAESAR